MILITGCTGYIGEHLAKSLLDLGMTVRGLVLPREIGKAAKLVEMGMDIWCGDLLLPETLRGITHGVTTIYHLAGIHTSSVNTMRNLYVQGAINLVEACSTCTSLELCVIASNGSAYGDGGEQWLFEDDYVPLSIHPFGMISQEMEHVFQAAYSTSRLPCVILRIADVYGLGLHNLVQSFRSQEMHVIGNGQNWTSHIHLQDLITILLMCAHLQRGAIYNVVDDQPVLSQEFYNYIAQQAAVPPPKWIPFEHVAERIKLSVHGLRSFSIRLSNAKLKARIPLSLQYPTYVEGIQSLLRELPQYPFY